MTGPGNQSQSKLVRWIDHRLPIFTFMQHELNEYPTPRNLSYWWNFGSLAGIMLVIMIVTGIFLAMQYTPNVDYAFNSVERIMRDVNFGWLLRYLHMNGASFFFIVVYIHLFRGLYYGSYKEPRELLWMLGVIILLLMMATAFMGYVLPWGQMSFWGATVITNLFSAIPVVGPKIVAWLWGGFAVGNPTLNRFYCAALPAALRDRRRRRAASHCAASARLEQPARHRSQGAAGQHPLPSLLHDQGHVRAGRVPDHLRRFRLLHAQRAGRSAELHPGEPAADPSEIVPEWYFLPFYAILRSVPDILFIPAKLAGVLCLFGAIGVLFFLPWLDTSRVRSARFRPIYKWVFWLLVIDVLVLGYCGAHRPEGWFIVAGRLSTLYYFVHFIVLFPVIGWLERPLPLPTSIAAAVTRKAAAPLGAASPMEKH